MLTLVIQNISVVETVTKVTCVFLQVRHIPIRLKYSSVRMEGMRKQKRCNFREFLLKRNAESSIECLKLELHGAQEYNFMASRVLNAVNVCTRGDKCTWLSA